MKNKIEKIIIRDFKGIKEQTLNFTLDGRGIKETQIGIHNSIVKIGDKNILTTPMLIGKNATGKTNTINAVKLLLRDHAHGIRSSIRNTLREENKEFSQITSMSNEIRGIIYNFEKTYLFQNKDELIKLPKEEVNRFKALFHKMMADEIVSNEQTFEFLKSPIFSPKINNYANNLMKQNGSIEELIGGSLEIFEAFLKGVYSNDNFIEKVSSSFFGSYDLKNAYIYMEFTSGEKKEFSEEHIIKMVENEVNNYGTKLEKYFNIIPKFFGLFEKNDIKMSKFKEYADIIKENDVWSMEHPRHIIAKKNIVFSNDNNWGGSRSFSQNHVHRHLMLLQKNIGSEALNGIITQLDKSVARCLPIKETNRFMIVTKTGDEFIAHGLSDGTKKIIGLLSKILIAETEIIFIDEIENGLNISLIDFIYKFAKENDVQIIATTHNPTIFERDIVKISNAFIYHDNRYKRLRDVPFDKNSRPELYKSIFRVKNYFNDYFWGSTLSEGEVGHVTVTDDDVDDIFDMLEDAVNAKD